jgi:GNAT superfamily N-acetyltransferase
LKIEITHFKENDRERLKLIYFEVRQTNFTWLSQESFNISSFDSDTEGESILVAKVDNEIVGFTSVWLPENFLHHLYVSNPFQGKGIGTLLLNSVIEMASSDITLKCLKKNKLGIKFYLKQGWESVSEGESNEGRYVLFRYQVAKN